MGWEQGLTDFAFSVHCLCLPVEGSVALQMDSSDTRLIAVLIILSTLLQYRVITKQNQMGLMLLIRKVVRTGVACNPVLCFTLNALIQPLTFKIRSTFL